MMNELLLKYIFEKDFDTVPIFLLKYSLSFSLYFFHPADNSLDSFVKGLLKKEILCSSLECGVFPPGKNKTMIALLCEDETLLHIHKDHKTKPSFAEEMKCKT